MDFKIEMETYKFLKNMADNGLTTREAKAEAIDDFQHEFHVTFRDKIRETMLSGKSAVLLNKASNGNWHNYVASLFNADEDAGSRIGGAFDHPQGAGGPGGGMNQVMQGMMQAGQQAGQQGMQALQGLTGKLGGLDKLFKGPQDLVKEILQATKGGHGGGAHDMEHDKDHDGKDHSPDSKEEHLDRSQEVHVQAKPGEHLAVTVQPQSTPGDSAASPATPATQAAATDPGPAAPISGSIVSGTDSGDSLASGDDAASDAAKPHDMDEPVPEGYTRTVNGDVVRSEHVVNW